MTDQKSGAFSAVFGVLVGIGALVALVWWQVHDFNAPASPADVAPQAAERKADIREGWIEHGKQGVLARLRDPDSAKFSDLALVQQTDTPDSYVLCGRVNARNGFGGYTGDRAFMAIGDQLAILEGDDRNFVKLWNQFCANHGRATETAAKPHARHRKPNR